MSLRVLKTLRVMGKFIKPEHVCVAVRYNHWINSVRNKNLLNKTIPTNVIHKARSKNDFRNNKDNPYYLHSLIAHYRKVKSLYANTVINYETKISDWNKFFDKQGNVTEKALRNNPIQSYSFGGNSGSFWSTPKDRLAHLKPELHECQALRDVSRYIHGNENFNLCNCSSFLERWFTKRTDDPILKIPPPSCSRNSECNPPPPEDKCCEPIKCDAKEPKNCCEEEKLVIPKKAVDCIPDDSDLLSCSRLGRECPGRKKKNTSCEKTKKQELTCIAVQACEKPTCEKPSCPPKGNEQSKSCKPRTNNCEIGMDITPRKSFMDYLPEPIQAIIRAINDKLSGGGTLKQAKIPGYLEKTKLGAVNRSKPPIPWDKRIKRDSWTSNPKRPKVMGRAYRSREPPSLCAVCPNQCKSYKNKSCPNVCKKTCPPKPCPPQMCIPKQPEDCPPKPCPPEPCPPEPCKPPPCITQHPADECETRSQRCRQC